jgi:hypothetical protein
MCEDAQRLVVHIINNPKLDTYYFADLVKYYGTLKTHDEVANEIFAYGERWPRLSYTNVKAQWQWGDNLSCFVTGELSFEAENSTKKSVGTANFEYGSKIKAGVGCW